jgi:hypothetical protein
LIVFPIGAALVAAAFSVATYRTSKPKDVALRVWSVALAQFAIACAAVAWGIGFGWTPMVYRAFYLFGAVLNVAWLALGTVWLFAPRKVAMVVNVLFIVAATGASGLVLASDLAPTAMHALAHDGLPAPREVMSDVPRMLSRIFSIGGSVIVLAGLLWSVVRRRYALGMGLLALGVVIAAVASEFARAGSVELFSAGLTLGIAVMYAGFLRTRA